MWVKANTPSNTTFRGKSEFIWSYPNRITIIPKVKVQENTIANSRNINWDISTPQGKLPD